VKASGGLFRGRSHWSCAITLREMDYPAVTLELRAVTLQEVAHLLLLVRVGAGAVARALGHLPVVLMPCSP